MEHQINITNHNWLQKKKSGEYKFMYCCRPATADRDMEKNVKNRQSKANQAFPMLQKIWKSKSLIKNTK